MRKAVHFAIHAERLHDDKVWERTQWVAERMAARGQRATFFVFPYRSQVAGHDIGERVRQIGALGHEIAQHTHFYDGAVTDGPGKRNDLSAVNVAACIMRDRSYLRSLGFSPRGFTAGSFIVTPELIDFLAQLGYTYDCSDRTDQPSHDVERIPTRFSVGEWFKRGWTSSGERPLVFVHDYDLVVPRYWLLWRLLLRTTGPAQPIGEHAGRRAVPHRTEPAPARPQPRGEEEVVELPR